MYHPAQNSNSRKSEWITRRHRPPSPLVSLGVRPRDLHRSTRPGTLPPKCLLYGNPTKYNQFQVNTGKYSQPPLPPPSIQPIPGKYSQRTISDIPSINPPLPPARAALRLRALDPTLSDPKICIFVRSLRFGGTSNHPITPDPHLQCSFRPLTQPCATQADRPPSRCSVAPQTPGSHDSTSPFPVPTLRPRLTPVLFRILIYIWNLHQPGHPTIP